MGKFLSVEELQEMVANGDVADMVKAIVERRIFLMDLWVISSADEHFYNVLAGVVAEAERMTAIMSKALAAPLPQERNEKFLCKVRVESCVTSLQYIVEYLEPLLEKRTYWYRNEKTPMLEVLQSGDVEVCLKMIKTEKLPGAVQMAVVQSGDERLIRALISSYPYVLTDSVESAIIEQGNKDILLLMAEHRLAASMKLWATGDETLINRLLSNSRIISDLQAAVVKSGREDWIIKMLQNSRYISDVGKKIVAQGKDEEVMAMLHPIFDIENPDVLAREMKMQSHRYSSDQEWMAWDVQEAVAESGNPRWIDALFRKFLPYFPCSGACHILIKTGNLAWIEACLHNQYMWNNDSLLYDIMDLDNQEATLLAIECGGDRLFPGRKAYSSNAAYDFAYHIRKYGDDVVKKALAERIARFEKTGTDSPIKEAPRV